MTTDADLPALPDPLVPGTDRHLHLLMARHNLNMVVGADYANVIGLARDAFAAGSRSAIAADRERAGSVDVRVVEDAERYRWLRDVVLEFNQTKGAVIVAEFIAPIAYGPDIDAAIDAARSKP